MSSVYNSSQYGSFTGNYAVDGKTSGKFSGHPCASTMKQSNPWLLLDLKNVYSVTGIQIVNRQDILGKWQKRLIFRHLLLAANSFPVFLKSKDTVNGWGSFRETLNQMHKSFELCYNVPKDYVIIFYETFIALHKHTFF